MPANLVPITAKVKESEKQEFISIAESIGTTPSNAIRMFIAAFNKRGGFPFDPANPYGYNELTLQAMRDVADGRNLSKPFSSVEEMMAELDADH